MTEDQRRYVRFMEGLTCETLDRLSDFVTPDVRFRDPFNDVRGVDAMRGVFNHMFGSVGPVRFAVERSAANGNVLHLGWRFSGRLRGRSWEFGGASIVTFDANGRVEEHLDYWDAATVFYEQLPFIGWLLRRIRRRISRC